MLSADLQKIPIIDNRVKGGLFMMELTQQFLLSINLWHYFKYQYKKENNQGTGKFEIHFQNDLDVYQIELGVDEFKAANQKQIINFKNIILENFKCFNWTWLQFKQNQKIDINLNNLYFFNSKLENFVSAEKDLIELETHRTLNVDNFQFEQSILYKQ